MAHDGSSRLNEFAPLSIASLDDLSVSGRLSLSSDDDMKSLAASGHLGSADIRTADHGAGFDFGSVRSVDDIAAAGYVDAIAVNLDLASSSNLSYVGVAAADSGPVGAPGAAGTLQTLSNYLTSGFWADRGASARWYNVTSSGTGANSGVLYYNVTGWSGGLSTYYGTEYDSDGISAARQVMVREAFKLYGAVLGITFIETTSTSTAVDFFFKDSNLGQAYEAEQLYSGSGGAMDYAVINVGADWYGSTSNIGGVNAYTFQTFLHEIGHALGLGHQGLYNAGSGSPTYANSAQWANDSWQQSMMSYWGQTENTEYSDDSYAQLVTPMAVDWIALNALYSGQGYGTSHAFTGNTIYGVGTNISTATSVAFANLATYAQYNAFTIVDGGGIDTIDFSNYNANQIIDLYVSTASQTHAWLSSVGGLSKNMTIAVGVVIENATTGGGNDTIYGNEANNILTGNGGNDYMTSYGGNDTEYGGTGNDTLSASDGSNYQDGGTGNDYLYGGIGNDAQYGGDGNDYLSGSSGNDYMGGGAGTDTLYGGAGNDTMWAYDGSGTNNGDYIYGGTENDFIYVGSGAETVDGGAGIDTLYQAISSGNYVFDMGTGATNQSGEVYTGFEVVYMGSGNDSITGVDAQADTIYGGDGNDTINPGGTTYGDVVYGGNGDDSIRSGLGDESMYGGAGIDVIDHRAWNGAYTFDMGTGLTNFGGELYTGFEIVYMGNGSNTVTGTSGDETIYGGSGSDTINDGAGNDSVYGGDGDDLILAGDSSFVGDSWFGGNGTDTLSYAAYSWGTPGSPVIFNFITGEAKFNIYTENFSGFEIFQGSQGDETIISDAGGHSFYGNDGNDSMVSAVGDEKMYGGNGIDIIDHTAWGFDYTFDMGTGLTQFTNELYLGFEVAYMGAGNDSVTGASGDETIYGGAGNDTINDGAGSDSVYGGDGNDLILAGDSSFVGDSWFGGNGTDTLSYAAYSWGTPFTPVVFNFVTGVASYNGFTENFSGFEIFQGSQGDETIIADGNSHTFFGNAGNDSMVAGIGLQFMYGGDGIDTIDLRAYDGDYFFKMGNGHTQFSGEIYDAFEVVYMGDGNDSVTGTLFDDTIYGGVGNDTINGFNSVVGDLIFGGDGNDSLVANVGNSTLDGGNGIDVIDNRAITSSVVFDMSTGVTNIAGHTYTNFEVAYMGKGGDVITGTAGDDTIYGGGGADTIYGGGGVDALYGALGDDYFEYVSGQGYDNIYGGAGVDTVLFQPFFGDDLAINLLTGTFFGGGANRDFVSIERITTSTGNDSVTGSNQNNRIDLGDGNDTGLGGVGNDVLFGGNGNDSLRGGTENDALYGGAGDDYMAGDAGDDTIFGAAGSDWLIGGAGNDSMGGGADNDTLVGGAGNDTMSGNAGSDHFVFAGNFGVDRILDFTLAGVTDVIDLTGVGSITSFANLVSSHLSQVGADAIITAGANTITLVGVNMNNLLADDFVF